MNAIESPEDAKRALMSLATCLQHHVVLAVERFEHPGYKKQVAWCPVCAASRMDARQDVRVQVTFDPRPLERIVLSFGIHADGVVFDEEDAERAAQRAEKVVSSPIYKALHG
jgi:hypothetical protein